MKKLNIERDLASRAAIAAAGQRSAGQPEEPQVEPVKPESDGTSEEVPGREDHPQGGKEASKPARKSRKAPGNV